MKGTCTTSTGSQEAGSAIAQRGEGTGETAAVPVAGAGVAPEGGSTGDSCGNPARSGNRTGFRGCWLEGPAGTNGSAMRDDPPFKTVEKNSLGLLGRAGSCQDSTTPAASKRPTM